jgi:hypothetical protein
VLRASSVGATQKPSTRSSRIDASCSSCSSTPSHSNVTLTRVTGDGNTSVSDWLQCCVGCDKLEQGGASLVTANNIMF